MGKKGRVLRKHPTHDQPSARKLRPRKGHISPHQIQSEILQDGSLPTERSLQIDESVVHHLDSVAMAADHKRPQCMLDENTDVSSIAMTSGWTKYLDRTYQLHSAKKSRTSVSSGSSLIEQSGNLEEMLKSPDKQPHFLRQHKNVVLKDVGTEVFEAAFTSPKAQTSAMSLLQPERVGEISVESLEETSPVLSHPFKRRRTVKVNASAFEGAFKDFVASSINSTQDVTDRPEESRRISAVLSAPALQNKKSRNEHVDTLKQQSHTPLNSASFNKRQTDLESMDTLPSPSRLINNATISAQALQNSKSRNEYIDTVEQQSDTPSGSASFNKRQSELKSILPGSSRRAKDASLSAQALQNRKSRSEHIDAMEQQSDTPSGSTSFNKRQSELSLAIVCGPSSQSGENESRKMRNSAEHRQSTSNKSMKPQNVPWFRQWQEKAAAAAKTCAFDLLPREERSAKLKELVTELKRKQDETVKVDLMKNQFISKTDEPENLKVNLPVSKKKVSRKPLRPDLLVNGKPYRPRLRRPKSWATPRLYKFILPKCEKKYGIMKARRKAEEFVVFLCEKVSTVIRRKKYEKYESILEEIKRALYELGVISCLMEYFVFIEDYLPFEYRIKAIPCLRAYGQRTGPPLPPGTDLFADLGY